MARGEEGGDAMEDRRAVLRRRQPLPEDLRGQSRHPEGPEPHPDRPAAANPLAAPARSRIPQLRKGGAMFKRWFTGSVVMVALALAACASDKDPAEKAIKAAEDAVNAAVADASKYVPEQAQAVQDALGKLKDSFAKGEYKAVLAGVGDVTARAKALTDAATAKKAELEKQRAELTKDWEAMSGGLPRVVDAIKSRVDILSQAKKLPAGLDKATVDAAKSGLETINKTWTDAQDAFKSGNVA